MNHIAKFKFVGNNLSAVASSSFSLGIFVCAGFFASLVSGQEDGPYGPGGPGNGFALSDFTATYSFSAEGDIDDNGYSGSLENSHFKFETSFSLPAPDSWMFASSISWSRDEFEFTGDLPLPETLESVEFSFMAMKDLSTLIGRGWSGMAILNTGFASDSLEFSGESLNLFGMIALEKQVSPDFSWNFGIVGMSRGDMKILPILGLKWNFADRWTLDVGFPSTAVSYQVNDALNLSAGVEMHGGTYYITESLDPALNDTYLDYQEIRIGLKAEYKVSNNLLVVLEGGTTAMRNFDYYDKDFDLDGDSTGYGSLSIRYQF